MIFSRSAMEKLPWSDRVLIKLIYAVAGLIILHLFALWMSRSLSPNPIAWEISNRLDVNDEASVPTWFSQIVLFCVALVSWTIARLEHGLPRKVWYLLAGIALLVSIDEVAQIHETIVQRVHVQAYGDAVTTLANNAWLIMAPFILVGAVAIAGLIWRILPAKTFRLIVGGGILYLCGAVGMELVSSGMDPYSWLYEGPVTALEELLEMTGGILFAYAAVDYLYSHHKAFVQKILNELSIKL